MRILTALGSLLFFAACQSAYYSTLEKFGIEKRQILVDRVEEARDAQTSTKEVFASALEEFSALVNFDGGNLEKLYGRLQDRFDDAEASAKEVRSRIERIEEVAGALFKEWEAELDQYTSDSFRQRSEEQLEATRERYGALIATMRRAEQTIPPVLDAFRDQVLFLKHNLNAAAVASLDDQVLSIENDVRVLIAEMETAIAEADTFIRSMK